MGKGEDWGVREGKGRERWERRYNTIQYNIRNLCTPSLTVKNRHESAMDVP